MFYPVHLTLFFPLDEFKSQVSWFRKQFLPPLGVLKQFYPNGEEQYSQQTSNLQREKELDHFREEVLKPLCLGPSFFAEAQALFVYQEMSRWRWFVLGGCLETGTHWILGCSVSFTLPDLEDQFLFALSFFFLPPSPTSKLF